MINRYILILLSVVVGSLAYSQVPVSIKGVLMEEWKQPIRLFKVDHGNMKEIAQSQPQTDNRFGFIFYPEYEGFYALGLGDASMQAGNFVFYFKGGDHLDVELSSDGYTITGENNSLENKTLSAWYQRMRFIEQRSFQWKNFKSNYTEFFPEVVAVQAQIEDFLQQHKTGNNAFDSRLASYMSWNLAACASTYVNIPHAVHPKLADFPSYYKSLSLDRFSSQAKEVYELPWGNRNLSMISMLHYRLNQTIPKKGLDGLTMELGLIQNDTLKGDAVLAYLARQKDFDVYKSAANTYNHLLLTDIQKTRATQIMNDMAQLKTGDAALNFSFPNVNGKIVQLADLKGKVVLVDVWATWCGPCKQQIPFLKQLEEEMKNTDLQVVSISVDEIRDRQKWIDMVKKENLGGLHLFAGGWGDFAKYYKITGIPRFMVFDRAGKIVSVNAPRPNDPELKELLNTTLNKK